MEGKLKNEKVINLLFLLLLFLSCSQDESVRIQKSIDKSLLQKGDIICRLGNSFYSGFFRNLSNTDKRFSHVGIVYKDIFFDSIYILHSELDDNELHCIQKTDLNIFLDNTSDWAIYRLKADKCKREAIVSQAQYYYYHKNIPFDMSFNIEDSSAFYCTEFIAKCVNNALDTLIIRPKSTRNDKYYIAVDDIYMHNCMSKIIEKD